MGQEDARVRIVIEGLEEGSAGLQKLLGTAAGGGPGAAQGGTGTGGGRAPTPGRGQGQGAADPTLLSGLLGDLRKAIPQMSAGAVALAALQEPLSDLLTIAGEVLKSISHLLGKTLGTTALGEEGRAQQQARAATQQFGMETMGAASPEQMRAYFDMQLQMARMAQRGRTMGSDASMDQAFAQMGAGAARTFHR